MHFQVIEGQRRRVQVFEGIVIKRQGAGVRETFTVRKQSFGVGVERTFPLHSPKIEKIEVDAIGDVNRAKLYYLRGSVGKKARVRASAASRCRSRSCSMRRDAARGRGAVDEELVAEAVDDAGPRRGSAEAEDATAEAAGGRGACRAEAEAEPAEEPCRGRAGAGRRGGGRAGTGQASNESVTSAGRRLSAALSSRPWRATGQKLLHFDRNLGARFVAGADEAGRGSLAGPLVVAGVLLDYASLRDHRVRPLAYLNDSKQCSRGRARGALPRRRSAAPSGSSCA